MEIFSALLVLCAGNWPVTGEFSSPRPVTWSSDVLIDMRLNKRLSEQSWGWWFDTPLCPLWLHCNEMKKKLDNNDYISHFLEYNNMGWL